MSEYTKEEMREMLKNWRPPDASSSGEGSLACWGGSGLIVRNHGQTWRKCPWIWGIDNMVTVESSVGLLVLCEITEHTDGPTRGQIDVRPIDRASLEDCPNTQKP